MPAQLERWFRQRVVARLGDRCRRADILCACADNFDGWARSGCTGWAYDDVLPYFKRFEDCSAMGTAVASSAYRGTSGRLRVSLHPEPNPTTLRFVAACEEVGLPALADYNGAQQIGAGRTQVPVNSMVLFVCLFVAVCVSVCLCVCCLCVCCLLAVLLAVDVREVVSRDEHVDW
jgi:choline dehydrogenase-like flavoprotein